MNAILQRLMYRHGWDTRSRNAVPARLLRPIVDEARQIDRPALLDVGCGNPGLASFLPDVSVMGVDLDVPTESVANITFQRGSVLSLPFSDRAFPVVTCIDVLEHLPEADRPNAVRELVRVASKAVLIACPHGTIARECDEAFRAASAQRHRPLPSWVEEHLRNPYPTAAAITGHLQSAAAGTGRSVRVSLSYCEPAAVTHLVRRAAVRSNLLYGFVNLFLGVLIPLFPLPSAGGSYRMVLLAELQEAEKRAGQT